MADKAPSPTKSAKQRTLPTDAHTLTDLLLHWSAGDLQAREDLFAAVYDELEILASSYLRGERDEHTFQTADLIHEAYFRLIRTENVEWQNRAHFFGIAARIMRCILVDHARRYTYQKRGSGARRVDLGAVLAMPDQRAPELVDLDQALKRLTDRSPVQAQIVEMRFFGGMNREEIAEVLGISAPTVSRKWRIARAWLYRQLTVTSGEP